MGRTLWAVLLVAWGVLPVAAQEVAWTPASARVFAVGVLEFEDPAYAGFPKEGRRDAELVQWFRDQGTPDAKIRYLRDARATRAGVLQSLKEHLAASAPGELLVFYYTGHGDRRKSGATYFIPRDAKTRALAESALDVKLLVDTIAATFKGDRVLLIADCCYSGALVGEVKSRSGDRSWACLTSSQASEVSTGNWTFTESLLSGLRGEPITDLDGDGTVLFSELASYVQAELAFVDGQLSDSYAGGRLSKHMPLTAVRGERVAGVGQRLEVLWEGTWYRAKVLALDPEKGARVHYLGFKSSWNEWVSADRRREWKPKQFEVGALVSVMWKDEWWKATVLEAKLGLHRIHYEGYSEVWDEWVSPSRIRAR